MHSGSQNSITISDKDKFSHFLIKRCLSQGREVRRTTLIVLLFRTHNEIKCFFSLLLVLTYVWLHLKSLCASTVNPVKKAQSAKVDPRLFVMQVMFLGEDCEEVISTMRNHRLQCSGSPKQKARKDMATQNLRR